MAQRLLRSCPSAPSPVMTLIFPALSPRPHPSLPRLRARARTDLTARQVAEISPSPPFGAERGGVRWGGSTPRTAAPPTSPSRRCRAGPLPLPPQAGGEGQDARVRSVPAEMCACPSACGRGLGRRQAEIRQALGRHLAHEIAFPDLDAETTENVVSRRRVEIKIRHREVIEVVLRAEGARLATRGNRDLAVLFAVELVGSQALEEIEGLVDPRLHLGVAVVDGGKVGHLDAGDAAGTKGVLARLPHLAGKREHVAIKPLVQNGAFVPLVPGRVRLGLFDHPLEAAEQLLKHRY